MQFAQPPPIPRGVQPAGLMLVEGAPFAEARGQAGAVDAISRASEESPNDRSAHDDDSDRFDRFGEEDTVGPDMVQMPSAGRMRTPSPYMTYNSGSLRGFKIPLGSGPNPKKAPRPTMRRNSRKKDDEEDDDEDWFDEDPEDEEDGEELTLRAITASPKQPGQCIQNPAYPTVNRMRTPSPYFQYVPAS